jgi:hypothetical protein
LMSLHSTVGEWFTMKGPFVMSMTKFTA